MHAAHVKAITCRLRTKSFDIGFISFLVFLPGFPLKKHQGAARSPAQRGLHATHAAARMSHDPGDFIIAFGAMEFIVVVAVVVIVSVAVIVGFDFLLSLLLLILPFQSPGLRILVTVSF